MCLWNVCLQFRSGFSGETVDAEVVPEEAASQEGEDGSTGGGGTGPPTPDPVLTPDAYQPKPLGGAAPAGAIVAS